MVQNRSSDRGAGAVNCGRDLGNGKTYTATETTRGRVQLKMGKVD